MVSSLSSGTAFGRGAAEEAPDELRLRDDQLDGGIDARAVAGQQVVQGLGLHGGAREAVQQDPDGSHAVELGPHHADDDVVGDEGAGVHDDLGALTELRAALHVGAKHGARRELLEAALGGEQVGLRALPAPGGPMSSTTSWSWLGT